MMRPCYKCKKNDWKYNYNNGWITATCQNCGNEVQFPAKRKKLNPNKDPIWAEYEMRDGRSFLKTNKTNDQFIEVGLKQGIHKRKWFMQVVPISKSNYVVMMGKD